ncbi:MAG: CBS domain-containing protein [Archangiaceae bacterium]|nr:CBS domain-containing protein [Archangiaceae bacterium]
MDDAIENFMTHSVHTVGRERTLTEAHALMRQHRIRHLPVLDGGKLVGLVSERDLTLIETLRAVDPKTATVEEAMTADVFVVQLGTAVAEVAHQMAHDKLGSAIIQRGNKVVGIFTAVDALSALAFLLSSPSVKHALHEAMRPAPDSRPS